MRKKNNISLFTVSFKQGFVSPKLPIASFYQGKKKLNFLLDTGSDKNVVNNDALKEIKHQIKEQTKEDVTHLSGVGGTRKVSICTITFGTVEESYTEDFLITDLTEGFGVIEEAHCITLHGILGSSFLKRHNVVIDFNTLSAYSKP